MLLNIQWVNKDIKKGIPWTKLKKKIFETNEDGNTMYQNLWDTAKKSSKREVHRDKSVAQETGKISNNLALYFKELKNNKTEKQIKNEAQS